MWLLGDALHSAMFRCAIAVAADGAAPLLLLLLSTVSCARCCCLHIKNHYDLCSVPSKNIRTGPTVIISLLVV